MYSKSIIISLLNLLQAQHTKFPQSFLVGLLLQPLDYPCHFLAKPALVWLHLSEGELPRIGHSTVGEV